MFDAIATVLAWFYEWTNNYGLSIMLLTLVIMLALTPLTLKGTRSMIAMQRLQPEMKKLQNRYKDDRQKLNEEMMKFYKENSINPVGGCLPLLIQMPVFFVLYRVLHGLTNHAPYGQDMGRAFGLASKNPSAVFEQFGTFHPDHLDPSTQLYMDLSVSRQVVSFGLDLSESASKVLSTDGLLAALPYLVLIFFIGLTAWYQQRQIQGRNPNMASQVNPQQQMLMKIMPYFLPIISFTLSAGVILYFLVSNLFRIGQQGFITRTMYRDAHGNPIETTAVDSTSTAGPQKGFFAQLREVAQSPPKPEPKSNGKGKPTPKANQSKAGQSKAGQAKARQPAKGGPSKGTPAKPKPSTTKPARKPAPTKASTAGDSNTKGADASSEGKPAVAPSRKAPVADPNRARPKRSGDN